MFAISFFIIKSKSAIFIKSSFFAIKNRIKISIFLSVYFIWLGLLDEFRTFLLENVA